MNVKHTDVFADFFFSFCCLSSLVYVPALNLCFVLSGAWTRCTLSFCLLLGVIDSMLSDVLETINSWGTETSSKEALWCMDLSLLSSFVSFGVIISSLRCRFLPCENKANVIYSTRASQAAQRSRICLPMQEWWWFSR